MNQTRKIALTLVAALIAVTGCSSSSDDGTDAPGGVNPAPVITPPVDGGEGDGDDGADEPIVVPPTEPPTIEPPANEPPNNEAPNNEPPANEPPNNEPPIETVASCIAIDLINVGTGSKKLTVDLNAGERIELTNQPRGTLLSLDETLGEIQYVPPQDRTPDSITYNILNADNSVVSQGEITLRLDPIRVMPLGDSITQGVEVGTGELDSPPVPLRVGYRQSLLEQLNEAGQVVDFTGQVGQRAGGDAGITDEDNNGYPGVDISFINDRVQEVFDELPSDVVLLHIGTNLTPDDASGIDAILNNIDAWELANFPVTVFVATLIPKRDAALQATVDQFNADLRIRVAARLSDNVVLVEQASAVSIDDIDSADVGVHPTAPGYLRMADVWLEAMMQSSLFPACE